MVDNTGVEPVTKRIQFFCSTTELHAEASLIQDVRVRWVRHLLDEKMPHALCPTCR